MKKIVLILISLYCCTQAFAQMGGAQYSFGANGPVQGEVKLKNYARGHLVDDNKSGVEALKALGLIDTIQSAFIDNEVTVKKINSPNAADTTYKVALLIGNSSYATDKVPTPVNDVPELSLSLLNAGFEVIEIRNCSKEVFMREIAKFVTKSKRAKYSVFYFGGHAINYNGDNYMAPVGVEPANVTELNSVTYNLTNLIKQIKRNKDDSRPDREALVVLDASRYNHFYFALNIPRQKSAASVSVSEGVSVLAASSNGYNAKTDYNETSLFGYILSRELLRSQSIAEVCQYTQSEVERLTEKFQKPWIKGKAQPTKLLK